MSVEKAANAANGKQIEAQARGYLDALAKPPGALGRLEDLAARLCVASGTLRPEVSPRVLVVFAADHGAVEAGVSLWPQSVSAAVAKTLLAGKAAASVMAAATQTSIRLVDVGLAGPPLAPHPSLAAARVRAGTRNMAQEAALSPEEFEAALYVGREAAARARREGARVLIAGEIGIGNTTAASALIALLCDASVDDVLGPGAGANAASRAAKRETIAAGLQRTRGLTAPNASIAALCGLEIAAMAGFYLEAATQNTPIVLDGAISGAAALIAQSIAPDCAQFMIAAHLSPEPAHRIALAKLGLAPMLDWGMRLGEGTGALALLPHLDIAAALLKDMASLEQALALAND